MSITLKRTTQNQVASGTSLTLSFAAEEGTTTVLLVATRSALTTPAGYTLLHTEAVPNYNAQYLHFLSKKNTTTHTESLTLQQASSVRFYAIAFVVDGVSNVTYETGYNNSFVGSLYSNKPLSKPSASASCIWGLTTAYANTETGYYYITPNNDVTMATSDANVGNGIRLVGIFDDGNGALTHQIRNGMSDSYGFAIDAVVLHEQTASTKYLIEDESQLYTIQNSALVPIAGTLSAALFESDGFDDLTNAGTLLATLTRPKLYAWTADALREVTVSVDAVPYPQDIIAQTALVEVIGIDEITATYSGSPLVAINVDNVGWICYNSIDEQWEAASDHDGMSIATMQSIPAEEWETLLTGASSLKVRITLTTTTDSVTAFEIAFLTN